MAMTVCECGLAKCYHEGDNPLAYRVQDGKVLCTGYEPRTRSELETYKLALEMALTVFLNGVEVASANHDSDGWSGMQSVEDTVKAIAGVLNIPVEEGSDEEESLAAAG